MRTDLEITKVDSFRKVKNVIVYLHKEKNYVNIDESNYSNYLIQNVFCCTCPPFFSKSLNSLVYCICKISNFEHFKSHCSYSEYLFGEHIIFKKDDELPNLSIYDKHRRYGYLANFKNKADLYVYDVKENRFIKRNYNKLTGIYTKDGSCNYCPCSKRFHSVSVLFKHLEILESRFSCYLVLDSNTLIYNDEKNRNRIQNYIQFIKSGGINNKFIFLIKNFKYSRVSTETLKINHKIEYQNECDLDEQVELDNKSILNSNNLNETSDDDDIFNNEQEINEYIDDNISSLALINELELNYKDTCNRLNNYITKLRNISNNKNLKKALIDNQNNLILIKKIEDYELNTKELIFRKHIQLNLNDLEYLDKKYNLNLNLYEIEKLDFKINLELEEFNINDNQFTDNFAVSMPNILDEFNLDESNLLGSTFEFKNNVIKIREIVFGDGQIIKYDEDDDIDKSNDDNLIEDNLNGNKSTVEDNLNKLIDNNLSKIKIEKESDDLNQPENKDKSNIVYEEINLDNSEMKLKREFEDTEFDINKRLKTD